jgi:hypothetical protein
VQVQGWSEKKRDIRWQGRPGESRGFQEETGMTVSAEVPDLVVRRFRRKIINASLASPFQEKHRRVWTPLYLRITWKHSTTARAHHWRAVAARDRAATLSPAPHDHRACLSRRKVALQSSLISSKTSQSLLERGRRWLSTSTGRR